MSNQLAPDLTPDPPTCCVPRPVRTVVYGWEGWQCPACNAFFPDASPPGLPPLDDEEEEGDA